MNSSNMTDILNIFYNHADERIRDRFLMGSPYKILLIYLTYIIIATKILPKIFKNRKPFDYNRLTFLHVMLIFTRAFYFVYNESYLWLNTHNWRCQPLDRSDSWISNLEVKLAHEFVVTKIIYTLQSFIIHACHKADEYTTYVWIHHATFPVMLWVLANYYPGGHTLFIGYVNALEHFCQISLQLIYLTFSLKFLRKYLRRIYTTMHIVQFSAILLHSSQILFLKNCSVPKILGLGEICGCLFIGSCYFYFLKKQELGKKTANMVNGDNCGQVSMEKEKDF